MEENGGNIHADSTFCGSPAVVQVIQKVHRCIILYITIFKQMSLMCKFHLVYVAMLNKS